VRGSVHCMARQTKGFVERPALPTLLTPVGNCVGRPGRVSAGKVWPGVTSGRKRRVRCASAGRDPLLEPSAHSGLSHFFDLTGSWFLKNQQLAGLRPGEASETAVSKIKELRKSAKVEGLAPRSSLMLSGFWVRSHRSPCPLALLALRLRSRPGACESSACRGAAQRSCSL
jgi:hypothetical protein